MASLSITCSHYEKSVFRVLDQLFLPKDCVLEFKPNTNSTSKSQTNGILRIFFRLIYYLEMVKYVGVV